MSSVNLLFFRLNLTENVWQKKKGRRPVPSRFDVFNPSHMSFDFLADVTRLILLRHFTELARNWISIASVVHL